MLNALSNMVAMRRRESAQGELEIRVGSVCGDGSFVAGINSDEFEQLHREMEAEASLESDESEWRQVVDYHYVAPSGERVRTRVECDLQGLTMNTSHITKSTLHDEIVTVQDRSSACRVACAREVPILSPPQACFPTHVRVKSRRRFGAKRDDRVVGMYELSRTGSGPSRVVVEGKQQNEAPVCEVECELVDEQGGYLSAHDDRYVAQSLMLKASSLLGTNLPLALRDKSRPLKRARPQGRTSESS